MAADGVSSDEWFTRYLLDAVLLVLLMLTALAVALYLDGSRSLSDSGKEPGAGFLLCLLLCPMLAVATLSLVVYAGVRVFLRPRTLGHAFVRLTFLAAHVSVFLVCADTISSTLTAVIGSVGSSSAARDPRESWRAIAGRDFSAAQEGERQAPRTNRLFRLPRVRAYRA